MKSKIVPCLAFVLSGILCGCSNAPVATNHSGKEQPFYVEENQILELKDKLWDAVRTKNAAEFVDCYFIEERFNTAEIREVNRKEVEKFFQGEIIDMEILEIPPKELEQIRQIQNGYSLVPQKILLIRRKTEGGSIGWRLLIGNKNGQWQIITFAGHTT